MNIQTSTPAQWWGCFELPHDSAGFWRIGPMELWIQRLHGEWLIARTMHDHDEDDDHLVVNVPAQAPDLLAFDDVMRFGVSGKSNKVTLSPLLADRSVITSPVKPFYIPPDETVTVYVGSPMWIRVDAGEQPNKLIEFPIVQPSDTWFGNNTYRGEMCYASRTACRLRLDEQPFWPYRAITAVDVQNRAASALLLERMKLPVQYLALYQVDSKTFWTGDLTIIHEEAQDLHPIRHRAEAPTHARGATLVAAPRQKGDDNLAMRVFSSLFR